MNVGDFELDKIYLGDAYELIKKIPDKSIDLIVTDPPYQFTSGGSSDSELGKRAKKNKIEIYSLDTEITKHNLSNDYMSGGGCFGTKNRNYHSQINDTDVSAEKVNSSRFVSNGISNEILEEFCRIMKNIYIYIYGVVKIN